MNKELWTSVLRVLPFIVIILVVKIKSRKNKIGNLDLYLHRPTAKSFLMWLGGFLVFTLLTEIVLYHYRIFEISIW